MSIIGVYDSQAEVFAARYESVSAETVHGALLDFLPAGRDLLALDVGAGSGRDAAWLASLGFDVVAVEPAAGMRREGQRRHSDLRIRWVDDRLPDMSAVHRLGLAFDLVLLSAVWMHVPPDARARAFRKVVTLLKPGGRIFISLREGASEADRPMWDTSPGEVEALSRSLGLQVLKSVATPDRLERPGVRWTVMCLRLPDDGAGALPLLRGIILKDGKSSTYKLGLLRAVARMADTAPALALARTDEDVVELPLGAVALNWLRMYIPLVRAGFPQRPTNSGPDGLDFAKDGFRRLLADGVVAQDLRIGMPFFGDQAAALRSALSEATHTIARRPAHYTTFPNSDTPVFAAARASAPRLDGDLVLDRDFLSAFGRLTVPGHVWRTLQRLGPWVEPVLVAEWARLIRLYADNKGQTIAPGEIETRLTWLDPKRDTSFARGIADGLFETKHSLTCVWTGAPLDANRYNIDHCIPWSAWPCSDLWNLLPSTPRVNQHLKKERIPTASVLAEARPHIIAWWDAAWPEGTLLRDRFLKEAAAALPVGNAASGHDVFEALEWRRLRLRQEQQIPEWAGVRGDANGKPAAQTQSPPDVSPCV